MRLSPTSNPVISTPKVNLSTVSVSHTTHLLSPCLLSPAWATALHFLTDVLSLCPCPLIHLPHSFLSEVRYINQSMYISLLNPPVAFPITLRITHVLFTVADEAPHHLALLPPPHLVPATGFQPLIPALAILWLIARSSSLRSPGGFPLSF